MMLGQDSLPPDSKRYFQGEIQGRDGARWYAIFETIETVELSDIEVELDKWWAEHIEDAAMLKTNPVGQYRKVIYDVTDLDKLDTRDVVSQEIWVLSRDPVLKRLE